VGAAFCFWVWWAGAPKIDGELFELFLVSGVYRRYAERFLQPAQIDAVDLAAWVAPTA
jgi:hypothetical protein